VLQPHIHLSKHYSIDFVNENSIVFQIQNTPLQHSKGSLDVFIYYNYIVYMEYSYNTLNRARTYLSIIIILFTWNILLTLYNYNTH